MKIGMGSHAGAWEPELLRQLLKSPAKLVFTAEQSLSDIHSMKPLICIPMGDPAGIGPEILVKSLCNNDFSNDCRIVAVGDSRWLQKTARDCHLNIEIIPFTPDSNIGQKTGQIHLFNCPIPDADKIQQGKVSAEAGRASLEFIKQATSLTQTHHVNALATTPINKESLKAAKIPFIGHTEILASLTNSPEPLTLFQVRSLRVFFLTRHLSLRAACDAVTEPKVLSTITRAIKTLEQLGTHNPSLAVAGLNPHCGEEGLFGDEEGKAIKPAIAKAIDEGMNVSGPYPADSVFHQALNGAFDGVLSLYHDQGHIATKMVDFERTISITCGLPFLRTSVDHGTAYDIAGKNRASEVSMTEAIRLAANYSARF